MAREIIPQHFVIALSQIGTAEVPGPESDQAILSYYKSVANKLPVQIFLDDSIIPWCAAFIGWCLKEAGVRNTGSLLARSYLHWGKKCEPSMGCLVILKRGNKPWQGHVGFFVKEEDGYVYILGGNQKNRVSIQAYKSNRVLGYRIN